MIVTVQAFRTYYRTSIDADDALILSCLTAAEGGINEACAREFVVAGAASPRSYAPDSVRSVLRIHDCTEITSVVEDGVTFTASQYVAEPAPQVAWSGQVSPYQQIRRYGSVWYTDCGNATVTVTAKWGWAAIPEQVKQAVYIAAKDLFDTRDVKWGIAAVGEYGPLSVRENRTVMQLVAPFRRVESFGIA